MWSKARKKTLKARKRMKWTTKAGNYKPITSPLPFEKGGDSGKKVWLPLFEEGQLPAQDLVTNLKFIQIDAT